MADSNTPSTLSYKLNEDAPLSFDQFYLIIRSLHMYKVKKITPLPDYNTVKVELLYNASMKNVRAKLGNVPATVDKQNPNILDEEIGTLDALRATFNFGTTLEEEELEVPKPNKKRCYKRVS